MNIKQAKEKIKKIDREIDERVFELYRLREEKKKIIEIFNNK